ncbi:MAG: virulence RhuM family protein [Deltaproteobacteria bacterium]|nr:virulence RhuM family protein [Deltaproteobacteria bacterium]
MNSKGAKVFRQRAAGVLRSYTLRGYVTAGKRTENGALPDDSYFELLLEEISEIRLSERGFYQMITTVIRR